MNARRFPLALALALALTAVVARGAVVEIEAGPIFADVEAKMKCPNVCSQRGAQRWTGDWHTTQAGRMSVCNCEFTGPGPTGGGSQRASATRPAPLPGSNACSVGGTAKCPGCAVACESGLRPSCTAPVDGVTSFCQRDAACRCER